MFAFFVIPAFLAVAAVSIWLASRSGGLRTTEFNRRKRVLLNVAGLLAAVTFTLFAVWAVPKSHNNSDWEPFLTKTALVIFGPLVIGTTLLTLRSLTHSLRPFLTAVAAGALLASIPAPFAVPIASYVYNLNQDESLFDSLCKNALVETIEHVSHVKSVAFLPDSFVANPPGHPSTITSASLSSLLLNQSLLEFIERPSTLESSLKDKEKFERVTTVGKRVPVSQSGSENTKFVYEPIEEITSEYIVLTKSLVVENGQELGLHGARIEIFRREDNKRISSAQYYWSYRINRFCPVGPRTDIFKFIYNFIAGSLDIANPEGLGVLPR